MSSDPATQLTSRVAKVRDRLALAANWVAVRASRDPRWGEAKDWRTDHGGGVLTPAKVCPRGCTHEVARRELVTRTSLFGQARIRVRFRFETETCTTCGSRLLERCGRCKAELDAPISDRCRQCGLPQPWSVERSAAEIRARPRRWRGDGVRDPAPTIANVRRRGELLAVEGDVTNVATAGILSNDDVDGRMYTVIALSIKRAAKGDVERQSIAQGPFPLGEAWYTDAGILPDPIRGIVHVASIDRRGDTDLDTVRRCLHSALDVARREGLDSLAIAAFGTGPRGVGPKLIAIDEWLAVAAETIVDHFRRWKPYRPREAPLAVLLVLYEVDDFANAVAIMRQFAMRELDSHDSDHGNGDAVGGSV